MYTHNYNYALHLSFTRPLNISTKEFGSEWGSLSHEKKVKVQCIMKPAEFMEAMKANLHFHPVELIGKKYIVV